MPTSTKSKALVASKSRAKPKATLKSHKPSPLRSFRGGADVIDVPDIINEKTVMQDIMVYFENAMRFQQKALVALNFLFKQREQKEGKVQEQQQEEQEEQQEQEQEQEEEDPMPDTPRQSPGQNPYGAQVAPVTGGRRSASKSKSVSKSKSESQTKSKSKSKSESQTKSRRMRGGNPSGLLNTSDMPHTQYGAMPGIVGNANNIPLPFSTYGSLNMNNNMTSSLNGLYPAQLGA